MNILSLFDGISCAQVATNRIGLRIDKYLASEIDKYAIYITQKNWPSTIQVGNVCSIGRESIVEDIDLLIGGSPCQDLSIAKKDRKGLSGDRSILFYEFVRILNEIKPKFFVFENVDRMSLENKEIITKELGVVATMIDAALVSGQSKKRLWWTNIEGIVLPRDRGIELKDVIQSGWVVRKKSYCLDACYYKGAYPNETYFDKSKKHGQGSQACRRAMVYEGEQEIRILTPMECERLQGLPDGYTEGISRTQRYKCLGNGMNVDVVAHILSYIKDLYT